MRLINAHTLQLESFSSSRSTPSYAILSHTWGKDEDEVSLEDMMPNLRSSQTEKKHGFEKIRMTCRLALREYNLSYAWIDTCCIDKSSSADLSESINSMFKWYHQAAVCFAFLADWEPEEKAFAHCKWFTRGWTLQELVASKKIIFYDKTWQAWSTKSACSLEIARITGIPENVLTGQTQLANVPVAVRMSWAAKRTTTREEDVAYSLLGIFDINMPMLYGEGHKAFLRLQEEIIKSSEDMSIFAWKALPETCQDYMGLIAPSPKEFQDASRMYPTLTQMLVSPSLKVSIWNRGIQFHIPLQLDQTPGCVILPVLHFDLPPDMSISELDLKERRSDYGIYLRQVGPSSFVRERSYCFADFTYQTYMGAISNMPLITVSKSLSAEDSLAVSRREIHIRRPEDLEHPDFGLVSVNPKNQWSSSLRKLVAIHNDYFIADFNFKPIRSNEDLTFALLCLFRNPLGGLFTPGHWKCDLVRGNDWAPENIMDYFSTRTDVLSGHGDEPPLGTKTLELPHLNGGLRTKRIVLSLQRELDAETGRVQFFIDLRVAEGD